MEIEKFWQKSRAFSLKRDETAGLKDSKLLRHKCIQDLRKIVTNTLRILFKAAAAYCIAARYETSCSKYFVMGGQLVE